MEVRLAAWRAATLDPDTQAEITRLANEDEAELHDAFGGELTFGTGGLRGRMGVGPNRMNRYTVARASLGLARFLRKTYNPQEELRVAIAYDSRHGSQSFAQIAAERLAQEGVRVYLYDGVRPTPQLSYTVRTLSCHAGIVITASHNPKEYNGFKVYGRDGGQVVSPQDARIIEEVRAVTLQEAQGEAFDPNLIQRIGPELDEAYLNATLASLAYIQDQTEDAASIRLVYTPIHGAGGEIVPRVLQRAGFIHTEVVASQLAPDGDFPTVTSPNPEEETAMSLALKQAQATEADIVLGTDPDVDRLGAHIRLPDGRYMRLDGNQIAILLLNFVLENLRQSGPPSHNPYIVRTIVTTPLLDAIARAHKVACRHVLTGFKHIARTIEAQGGFPPGQASNFVMGAEESHGYLVGDTVRDKDAVQAALLMARMTAYYRSRGTNLADVLAGIYKKHGLWVQGQLAVVKEGAQGRADISEMMERLRNYPPSEILGERFVRVYDYQSLRVLDVLSGNRDDLDFEQADVVQLETTSGWIITARPSGTEPKIKFYFSILGEFHDFSDVARLREHGMELLNELIK